MHLREICIWLNAFGFIVVEPNNWIINNMENIFKSIFLHMNLCMFDKFVNVNFISTQREWQSIFKLDQPLQNYTHHFFVFK